MQTVKNPLTEPLKAPSSPFWHPDNQVPREFPEMISDSWYFREFIKGVAEGLTPDDWQRIYRTLKSGVKAFIMHKGLSVNGMVESFQVGLFVGKAMRDEFFKGDSQ